MKKLYKYISKNFFKEFKEFKINIKGIHESLLVYQNKERNFIFIYFIEDRKIAFDFNLFENKKDELENILINAFNINKIKHFGVYIDDNLGDLALYSDDLILINSKTLEYKVSQDLHSSIAMDILSYVEKYKAKKNPVKPVTFTIILLNAILFLVTLLISRGSFSVESLIFLGALFKPLVIRGEYFRILTSIFLHGGVLHFFSNMFVLFTLGNMTEELYGKRKYLFIYLFSGIFGNVLTLIFGNSNAVSIGASGSIFGLFGAILIYSRLFPSSKYKINSKALIQAVFINLLIGFLVPNIGNLAHIGGLLGGLLAPCLLMLFNLNKKSLD